MKKNYFVILTGAVVLILAVAWLLDFGTSALGSSSIEIVGNTVSNNGGKSKLWLPWSEIWAVTGVCSSISLVISFLIEVFKKEEPKEEEPED